MLWGNIGYLGLNMSITCVEYSCFGIASSTYVAKTIVFTDTLLFPGFGLKMQVMCLRCVFLGFSVPWSHCPAVSRYAIRRNKLCLSGGSQDSWVTFRDGYDKHQCGSAYQATPADGNTNLQTPNFKEKGARQR